MTHRKYLSPLAACLLIALFASPAIAETETEIEIEGSATIETGTPGAPPMKPLDVIKARAQQIKQGSQNAKKEWRSETEAEFENAERGEKKEVLKEAWGERKEIAKDRFASTTQLARGVKALALMHGGVIKNRFNLAVSHLNGLLDRMDARLEKMTAAGVDTAAVVTLHTSAEGAVAKAEADANAVADYLATVNESSDRATVKTELQAKVKTAQESLKAAHKAVMDTVRALVALAKENKPDGDADASVESSSSVETDVQ